MKEHWGLEIQPETKFPPAPLSKPSPSRARSIVPGNNPSRSTHVTTASFKAALAALRDHRAKAPSDMRKAFADDSSRFAAFSLTDGDMLLDYSKCAVDAEAMELRPNARQRCKPGSAAAMRCLPARRSTSPKAAPFCTRRCAILPTRRSCVDGGDVMPDVHAVLDAMARFSDAVRYGRDAGRDGQDDSPTSSISASAAPTSARSMATLALAPYHDGPRAAFRLQHRRRAYRRHAEGPRRRRRRCSSSPRRPSPPSRR